MKQKIEEIKYSHSNELYDCDPASSSKFFNLLVGEVENFVYQDSVGVSVPYPDSLNEQVYSIGRKFRGKFQSFTNYFKDVVFGKGVNDFEDIKSSFHCHPNIDVPAEYVNQSRDKVKI